MAAAMRWIPLSTAQRQLAFIWAGLAIALLALRPVWPVAAPWLRPCLFHSLTGIPCPTCGGTRSVLALLDGRVAEAASLNPLVFAATLTFLVGGLIAPLWTLVGGTAPSLDRPLPLWLRIAVIAVVVVNWGWLIATL